MTWIWSWPLSGANVEGTDVIWGWGKALRLLLATRLGGNSPWPREGFVTVKVSEASIFQGHAEEFMAGELVSEQGWWHDQPACWNTMLCLMLREDYEGVFHVGTDCRCGYQYSSSMPPLSHPFSSQGRCSIPLIILVALFCTFSSSACFLIE